MTYQEFNKQQKAKQEKRAAEFMEMVEVGTIFYASWGYEQTQTDFFEVVKKTAKTVTLRPIESTYEACGTMDGYVMPVPGKFREFDVHVPAEGKRFKMQGYDSVPSVSLCSYANAYMWDGKKKHESSWY